MFAREVVAADKADAALPWLLYLQGGPGFGSPRPIGRDSWLNRALDDYRVLLLDQRGTGASTPANRLSLAALGSPTAQADYLALFRADNIVRDAERIRHELAGGAPWSVLGQSFGGFCAVTYLSLAADGVREAFITGGLPGLDVTADDVYRVAYPRVAAKNTAHYGRYPADVERVRWIARHLAARDIRLPGGGLLTVENFQVLGRILGMSELAGATRDLPSWAATRGLAWDVTESPAGERWGCRLEVYFTNPAEEPDPATWETELVFRLAGCPFPSAWLPLSFRWPRPRLTPTRSPHPWPHSGSIGDRADRIVFALWDDSIMCSPGVPVRDRVLAEWPGCRDR